MNGKRKYDELLEKDLKAVKNLLKPDNTSQPLKLCKLGLYSSTPNPRDSLSVGLTNPELTAVLQATRDLEKSQRKHVETKEEFIDPSELRKVIDEFVEFYERLDTLSAEDAHRKPKYSYTELIFLAVMRSPNFCLPIHEIYRYIGTSFPYYLTRSSERWKNAVRHSLSKTRCFSKIGGKKSRQRSGLLNRSCYLWTIVPKSLLNFARGDYRSSVDNQTGTNTLKWAFYQVDASSFWKKCADSVGKVIQQQRMDLEKITSQSSKIDQQICLVPESHQDFSSSLLEDSWVKLCHQISTSGGNTASIYGDEHSAAVSSIMAISSQPSCVGTNGIGTSTSSSDSELNSSNSPPDSGHETFSEFSSPDDLYRQFILFQSPQVNPMELSLLNESCQSPWSMMETSMSDMNNICSMPTLPAVQLSCHSDENENLLNVYNYLPLLDSLVPESTISDCMTLYSSDLGEANSIFAENSDESCLPGPTFTEL